MKLVKARLIPSLCERIIRFYSSNPSNIVCKQNEEFLEEIESHGRLWHYLMDSDPEYFTDTREVNAVFNSGNQLLEILGTNNLAEQGLLDSFGCLLIRTFEDIQDEVHRDAWSAAEQQLSDLYEEGETYSEKLRNYIGRI